MKKRFLLVTLSMFCLCSISPSHASGLIEFFFPMLKREKPNPSKTLQAPFTKKDPSKSGSQKINLPEDSTPTNLPHRTPAQMADWFTTIISESMNFTSADYDTDLQKIRKYFTDVGWKEYQDFLLTNNIQAILETRRYSIRSFVEETPILINKGVVNNSYKWLYEITLMTTYTEKRLKNYDGQKEDPVTQTIVLSVQTGRTTDSSTDGGVLIDHWDGKVTKSSKNEL